MAPRTHSGKTHKGLSKRIKISARGKVLHKPPGKSHLMSSKPAKRARRLRKWRAFNARDLKVFEEQYGKL